MADALCVVVAYLPVLGSAIWKAFLRPRPFWAFLYDPETFYFHDGLRLLHGHAPLDYTNPGTPVQLLSSVVAAATGATGATPEQLDRFRAVGYGLGWTLQLLSAFLLLRTVLARVPLTLRVAALATYFVAATSLEYETVWSPELLYFPVGALALAAVWRALGRRFDLRSSIESGAVIGLACAVKFLFLPWLLAGGLTAAVGAGPRGRLRAVAALAFGAGLAFAMATLPAAANYPAMAAWLGRLIGRSGSYGSSAHALPSLSTLLHNAATVIAGAKGWYLWILLVALAAWDAVRHAESSDQGRRLRGFALFAATAAVIGHLAVIRSPGTHYLLAAAVAAMGLAAVAAHAPQLRRSAALRAGALVMLALLLGKHVLADARTHLARNASARHWRAALAGAVERQTAAGHGPVVVYGYGTPVPSLALRYFATDPAVLRSVESIYPAEGHLGPGDRLFLPGTAREWDVMVVTPGDRDRYGRATAARVAERVGPWDVLVAVGKPLVEVRR